MIVSHAVTIQTVQYVAFVLDPINRPYYSQAQLYQLSIKRCEMHRHRIVRDGVTQIIDVRTRRRRTRRTRRSNTNNRPRPVICVTSPAVEYDYRGSISQRYHFIFISHALKLIKCWGLRYKSMEPVVIRFKKK